MTLVWTRVDQKLIHGQVSVAWVPFLGVDALVVVDAEVAEDMWAQKVMMMGLPPEVRVTRFIAPEQLPETLTVEELRARRVMVIFKNLKAAMASVAAGLRLESLNLGNQACQSPDEDVCLCDSFFASQKDLAELVALERAGLNVFLQSVPNSKAVKWKPGC